MRRSLFSLVAVLLLSLIMASCGGGGKGTSTAETPGAGSTGGTVTIDLWHSEPGAVQKTLQGLIDRFNSSQNEVQVRATFQGTPPDLMAKLVTSLGSGQVPAIAMLDDVSAQKMVDSGDTTPVQDFVDREGYDLSDVNETLVNYYTVEGKLLAMPFCAGLPLLYYNKAAFRDAGLDPEKPPKDLEEVRQYSEKLLKRDSGGNVSRTGMALDIQSWTERIMAMHGDFFVDNNNGHDGRATKVMFDNDTGRWFFEWWHDMVDSGLASNVGRNPNYADTLVAVANGLAGMAFSYSSSLGTVTDTLASGAFPGLELGVAAMPGVPGGTDIPYVMSRGLWVLNLRPEAEQEAAWKFIKWLMEPEQQAEWFAGSGYLPASRAAVDLPTSKDVVTKYPLFQVPLDLYLNKPATSPAENVALLGPYQEVREQIALGIEAMLAGVQSPDDALASAADKSNKIIEDYNQRIGG